MDLSDDRGSESPSEEDREAIDGDDGEEEGWEDWEEDGPQPTLCLFCDNSAESPNVALEHMRVEHQFDLSGIQRSNALDELQTIRLVNWIRKTAPSAEAASSVPKEVLENDDYLMPVLQDDPLLYSLDFDADEDAVANGSAGQSAPEGLHSLHAANKALEEAREELRRVQEAFAAYRNDVQKVFTETVLETDVAEMAKDRDAEADGAGSDEEDYYFKSYSNFGIHEQMIKDRARTDAYRDFMYENKDLFKDKVVLDVGCGTGILSMFAVKAGAKHVYSIDASSIIDKARKIVELNDLGDKITLIKGRVEDLDDKAVPEPVDILVSEWMGYCLLYESMLDSVVFARNRWLKPDGLMVPDEAIMFASTISDDMYMHDRLWWWEHVYGFDMSPMKELVVSEAQVDVIPEEKVSSEPVELISWNLHTCGTSNLDFDSTFSVPLAKDVRNHGLVIWFDCIFDGPRDAKRVTSVALSTSPMSEPTHWKQTVLIFPEPVEVTDRDGGLLSVKMRLRKARSNKRELVIDCTFEVAGSVVAPAVSAWSQRWYVR
ncbi:S-adenosyl-L-methionine-dependent methyltransferase [Hyaloraphidium curvatum]|nr:S-adenosyl-L-methionine-dependent methyltransferase [Hyaloraphidium curvatum]